jgi:hypothetical protein
MGDAESLKEENANDENKNARLIAEPRVLKILD